MARIELQLQPFITPDYAIVRMPPRPRQAGLQEPTRIPLSELPMDVLLDLCNDFKEEVLRKAAAPVIPSSLTGGGVGGTTPR